jgi:hypothetical protein
LKQNVHTCGRVEQLFKSPSKLWFNCPAQDHFEFVELYKKKLNILNKIANVA